MYSEQGKGAHDFIVPKKIITKRISIIIYTIQWIFFSNCTRNGISCRIVSLSHELYII